MSKEVFKFNKQLDIGNEGEALFLNTYEGAKKSNDLKYDFLIGDVRVELKSDTYPMNKTPNFFMERYSSEDKKTDGGVWRSVADGVDFFVYLFLSDKVFYWFEPKRLKRLLDNRIKDMKPKKIFNKGYNTTGYLIDRNSVKHLVIQEDKL